eukprot:403343151
MDSQNYQSQAQHNANSNQRSNQKNIMSNQAAGYRMSFRQPDDNAAQFSSFLQQQSKDQNIAEKTFQNVFHQNSSNANGYLHNQTQNDTSCKKINSPTMRDTNETLGGFKNLQNFVRNVFQSQPSPANNTIEENTSQQENIQQNQQMVELSHLQNSNNFNSQIHQLKEKTGKIQEKKIPSQQLDYLDPDTKGKLKQLSKTLGGMMDFALHLFIKVPIFYAHQIYSENQTIIQVINTQYVSISINKSVIIFILLMIYSLVLTYQFMTNHHIAKLRNYRQIITKSGLYKEYLLIKFKYYIDLYIVNFFKSFNKMMNIQEQQQYKDYNGVQNGQGMLHSLRARKYSVGSKDQNQKQLSNYLNDNQNYSAGQNFINSISVQPLIGPEEQNMSFKDYKYHRRQVYQSSLIKGSISSEQNTVNLNQGISNIDQLNMKQNASKQIQQQNQQMMFNKYQSYSVAKNKRQNLQISSNSGQSFDSQQLQIVEKQTHSNIMMFEERQIQIDKIKQISRQNNSQTHTPKYNQSNKITNDNNKYTPSFFNEQSKHTISSHGLTNNPYSVDYKQNSRNKDSGKFYFSFGQETTQNLEQKDLILNPRPIIRSQTQINEKLALQKQNSYESHNNVKNSQKNSSKGDFEILSNSVISSYKHETHKKNHFQKQHTQSPNHFYHNDKISERNEDEPSRESLLNQSNLDSVDYQIKINNRVIQEHDSEIRLSYPNLITVTPPLNQKSYKRVQLKDLQKNISGGDQHDLKYLRPFQQRQNSRVSSKPPSPQVNSKVPFLGKFPMLKQSSMQNINRAKNNLMVFNQDLLYPKMNVNNELIRRNSLTQISQQTNQAIPIETARSSCFSSSPTNLTAHSVLFDNAQFNNSAINRSLTAANNLSNSLWGQNNSLLNIPNFSKQLTSIDELINGPYQEKHDLKLMRSHSVFGTQKLIGVKDKVQQQNQPISEVMTLQDFKNIEWAMNLFGVLYFLVFLFIIVLMRPIYLQQKFLFQFGLQQLAYMKCNQVFINFKIKQFFYVLIFCVLQHDPFDQNVSLFSRFAHIFMNAFYLIELLTNQKELNIKNTYIHKKMNQIMQSDQHLKNLVQLIPYGIAVLNLQDVSHFNYPFGKVFGVNKQKQVLSALMKFKRKIKEEDMQSSTNVNDGSNQQNGSQKNQSLKNEYSGGMTRTAKQIKKMQQKQQVDSQKQEKASKYCNLKDDLEFLLNNKDSAFIETNNIFEIYYVEQEDQQQKKGSVVRDGSPNSANLNKSYQDSHNSTIQAGRKYYSISISPIEWNNKQCLLLTVKDITHEKIIDQKKVLDRLRNMIFKSFSHELKTPLNGIIMSLETAIFIHKRIQIYLDSVRVPQVVEIAYQGKQMLGSLKNLKSCAFVLKNIMHDFFDYNQLQSNEITLNIKEFDLIDCIKDVEKIVKYQIQSETVKFYSKIEYQNTGGLVSGQNQAQIKMICDRDRLQQILLNLIMNAIKFTNEGKIELEVFVKLAFSPQCVNFKVKDTGIGIEKSRHPNIFNLFEQNENSNLTQFLNKQMKSARMGLPISQNLCQLMGGHIHLDSEVGQGSIFSFELPLRPYDYDQQFLYNKSIGDQVHKEASEYSSITKRTIEILPPSPSDRIEKKHSFEETKSLQALAGGTVGYTEVNDNSFQMDMLDYQRFRDQDDIYSSLKLGQKQFSSRMDVKRESSKEFYIDQKKRLGGFEIIFKSSSHNKEPGSFRFLVNSDLYQEQQEDAQTPKLMHSNTNIDIITNDSVNNVNIFSPSKFRKMKTTKENKVISSLDLEDLTNLNEKQLQVIHENISYTQNTQDLEEVKVQRKESVLSLMRKQGLDIKITDQQYLTPDEVHFIQQNSNFSFQNYLKSCKVSPTKKDIPTRSSKSQNNLKLQHQNFIVSSEIESSQSLDSSISRNSTQKEQSIVLQGEQRIPQEKPKQIIGYVEDKANKEETKKLISIQQEGQKLVTMMNIDQNPRTSVGSRHQNLINQFFIKQNSSKSYASLLSGNIKDSFKVKEKKRSLSIDNKSKLKRSSSLIISQKLEPIEKNTCQNYGQQQLQPYQTQFQDDFFEFYDDMLIDSGRQALANYDPDSRKFQGHPGRQLFENTHNYDAQFLKNHIYKSESQQEELKLDTSSDLKNQFDFADNKQQKFFNFKKKSLNQIQLQAPIQEDMGSPHLTMMSYKEGKDKKDLTEEVVFKQKSKTLLDLQLSFQNNDPLRIDDHRIKNYIKGGFNMGPGSMQGDSSGSNRNSKHFKLGAINNQYPGDKSNDTISVGQIQAYHKNSWQNMEMEQLPPIINELEEIKEIDTQPDNIIMRESEQLRIELLNQTSREDGNESQQQQMEDDIYTSPPAARNSNSHPSGNNVVTGNHEETPPYSQNHHNNNNSVHIPQQIAQQHVCPKIMIVDDVQMNRFAIEQMLLLIFGLKVLQAENGQQSIDRLRDYYMSKTCDCEGIKLILMDLEMPVMNGIRATIKLKKMMSTGEGGIPEIPIVALTAYIDEKDNCIKAGMKDFLTKPTSKAQLKELLQKFRIRYEKQ